ncbi:MAG: hypothetical protein GY913_00715 [Proteobacteria bacterium]|nr:hypothetical protein [Pseudomonadota bacterium]MCP4915419.1 hypothetical protein [Pseudomonadota bacterium]
MWLALTAALVPVAIGVGLALTPVFRRGLRGPASAFAIAVALAVVFGELLPEASAHGGALFFLAVGLLGPGLVERAGQALGKRSASKEFGFLGLCVHQVIDGLQVGSAMEFAPPGVAVAVGAHSVPLVAAVVFGFARRDGARSAGVRGLILLACTAAGATLGHNGTAQLAEVGWLPALVGGLLLHVLWHDLWEQPPHTTGARIGEVGAFAAGLALPMAWAHHHHHELEESITSVLSATGPALLVGLVLTALVRAGLTRFPVVSSPLGAIGPAARLPLTACSVLPVTESLVGQKTPSRAVLAFLLLAPALGMETLVLSVPLLGPKLAGARLALAVIPALIAAALMARSDTAQAAEVPVAPEASFGKRALFALDETLLHVGPWLVAGVTLAIFVDAWLSPEDLGGLGPFTLIAIPAFVCATSALPLAAVLLAKGASPALVVAALVVGPALNAASIRFLHRTYGKRVLLVLAVFVGLVALGAAGLGELAPWTIPEPPPFAMAAAALVGLLLFRSIWTVGPRGWLAVLSDLGGPGTGHDHGHDHGHAHEHAHAGHDVHADPVEAVHAGERAHDHCHEHDDE